MNTSLEESINEQTEIAAVEAPKQEIEFSRGQLGKAKRSFAKAGQPDANKEVLTEWLTEMGAADVSVVKFSSSRLAKLIKGELTVAQLRG